MSAPETLRRETRAPGTVRANRFLLLLLAVLLLGLGVVGLIVGLDVIPGLPGDRPVLSPQMDAWIGDQWWFWPAVCLVALLLVLFGVRWLLAQGRSDRLGRLPVEDSGEGRTELETSAVTDAVVAEIQGYRGVRNARAHLHGGASEPELSLDVDLDGRAGIGVVHRRVATEAVAHVRTALESPDLPVRLVLHLSKRDGTAAR